MSILKRNRSLTGLRGFCLIMILMSSVPLIGISHGQAPPATTLRFGARRELSTMNPFVRTLSYDHNLRTLMYEPLLLEDKAYQIRPYLAEEWRISKDGLVYTFQIRQNVKFHNGAGLTAEDIKWSMEYALDPKNRAYGNVLLSTIRTIQATEPHRLRVTLKEPMASFFSILTTLQTLPIVPKDSLGTAEKPQVFPPGTGPYRFDLWKPGQGVQVSRFQDYWQKGIPRIAGIDLKLIPDDEARFAALRAGDVDLIERLPLQFVSKIQKGEIPGFKIATAEASGLKALIFNTKKPPFNNIKMRQMIARAVDARKVLKGAYWDVGTVTNQKMFPGSPWYFPLPDRKRDLASAKKLLKEAGYGPDLRIRLAGTRNVVDALSVIQSQIGEVGIDVDLHLRGQAESLKSYATGDFEIAFTAAQMAQDPDRNYFDDFHTEILVSGRGRRRGNNHSGYSNPQVDRLLEEGRRTLDPQNRYRIYHDFVKLIYQEIPVLYLFASPNLYVYRSQLKGLEMAGEGRYFAGDAGFPFAWFEN